LRAKSNNKIKTKRNIIKKERGKVHSVEQFPILLVNDEKLKDPTDIANACKNFFLTITEKCNIQQIQKEDAISILKDLFLGNFPKIKINPYHWNWDTK